MSCHQKQKQKNRSENQNKSIFIPYYVILTEGSVVSHPHGQQSYETTLRIFEKLWEAQRPPNISKVDYYHFFFFLKTPVFRELVRILCSIVFPWATAAPEIVSLLCCERGMALFIFFKIIIGLFKSDTSVLLFLQQVSHIDKQCGIILNSILKFL